MKFINIKYKSEILNTGSYEIFKRIFTKPYVMEEKWKKCLITIAHLKKQSYLKKKWKYKTNIFLFLLFKEDNLILKRNIKKKME